jgi:hypothetical protein
MPKKKHGHTQETVYSATERLGWRIRRIYEWYGPSWREDVSEVMKGGFDTNRLIRVVEDLEQHWLEYLRFRPESEQVRPRYTELLHPTMTVFDNLREIIANSQ